MKPNTFIIVPFLSGQRSVKTERRLIVVVLFIGVFFVATSPSFMLIAVK